MVVICDKSSTCKHALCDNHSRRCGGSKPHSFHKGECNKCPMDKDAHCLPYDNGYDAIQHSAPAHDTRPTCTEET